MQPENLKKKYGGIWSENIDLCSFTWLHLLNTYARFVWEPTTTYEVYNFILENEFEYSIIGNGSNTLLGNIDAVLISTKSLNRIEFNGDEVEVEAGTLNYKLISACLKHNLGGIEFLHTIPGTIGGALCTNAGAHGDEICNYITWVECIDQENRNLLRLYRNEIEFDYRFSSLSEKYFILKAGMILKKICPEEVKSIINRNREYVEEKQPRHNTLGSTFKNPPGKSAWQILNLLPEDDLKSKNVFFSSLHRNFLINTGTASHIEVFNFIQDVQKKVRKKTGEKLDLEIKILGNFKEVT